ncbi:MAG TPA: SpoIID/LytB domain-containing protein, partial [Symbiobacteriaceae bacterium]|nr:SpoIID/LytB domain-containing protein [Symbiobacteriaceae bacterium]
MRRLLFGGFVAMLVLVAVAAIMGRTLNTPTPVEAAKSPSGVDTLPIQVYFPGTKTIQTLPLGEYLKGVVAAEMPSFFATEALKAQFVVARTYAVRRMQQFTGPGRGGCPLEPRADVCADPNTSQDYVSREDLEKRMGAAAAGEFWSRLDSLQAETDGQVLRYQSELIDPLYHSVSGTRTEESGSFFSQSLPYLKSVDDQWGARPTQVQLRTTAWYTPEQLVDKLGSQVAAVPVVANSVRAGKAPVQIAAYTESGRVKAVTVLGTTISGREFR